MITGMLLFIAGATMHSGWIMAAGVTCFVGGLLRGIWFLISIAD